MKSVRNPRSTFLRLKNKYSFLGVMAVLLFSTSCDFESPSDFKSPTWYIDLKFPLVQEQYKLDGIVDNKQIFPTADSLGMQLVFEDTLPKTAISASYLEVPVGAEVPYVGTPATSPNVSIVIDTVIDVTIPLTPGTLVDITGTEFSIPPTSDKQILSGTWNTLVSAFNDTSFPTITIPLPEIDESVLPEFITEVSGVMVQEDAVGNASFFKTVLHNDSLLTNIDAVQFLMLTGQSTNPDTLASHTQSEVSIGESFTDSTSIGDSLLADAIQLKYDFSILSFATEDSIVTVPMNSDLQINMQIRIRIAGVDRAVVEIEEYDMPTELDPVSFPSTVEIYSGVFKTGTGFGINEIAISNLKSTYPFYMDFIMNFKNFIPPASGGDSVKVDTALHNDYSTYNKTFYIDGYTFSNPAGADSALSKLVIDLTARLRAQTAYIPLDGSELGNLTINVNVDELHFASLEANIIENFPPSTQNIAGMPTGFTGMSFTGVQFEFDMVNQIDLPVKLDVDMVGYNSLGDSSTVEVRATIAKPSDYGSDSTRTVIRMSKIGTTVLSYATVDAATWTDSVTTPPTEGTSTIVDLLSFNPATMIVRSAARIDGRGTIVGGASIGGKYRMVAPFEVMMDPMTFISVTETPIAEMSHDMRSRIRSSLIYAELTSTVTNSIPVGGEISILLSNKTLFPLDTTQEMLSIFRDSLAAQETGWSTSDSLYVVNKCAELNPDSSADDLYIFSVMNDFTECVDGMVYLVRFNPAGKDTVISYVDTLLKVLLPDPAEFYSDTSTVGTPGQVKTPGVISYASVIDTTDLFLLTDYGDHYTAPRFHLNGTAGQSVYLTSQDYMDIRTFMVFRLSNTGMFDPAPNEIVMLYPNGGETLASGEDHMIKWKTYGTVSTINVDYAIGANPSEDDWVEIASEAENIDSLEWSPDVESDSLRIRVRDPDSYDSKKGKYVQDISGWYFSVSGGRAAKIAGMRSAQQFSGKGFER